MGDEPLKLVELYEESSIVLVDARKELQKNLKALWEVQREKGLQGERSLME